HPCATVTLGAEPWEAAMKYATLSCLSLFALIAISADAQITLVDHGQPRATIVIADDPAPQAEKAASALQAILAKMSGATLPIARASENVSGTRVLVGQSAALQALGIALPNGHTAQMAEEHFIV